MVTSDFSTVHLNDFTVGFGVIRRLHVKSLQRCPDLDAEVSRARRRLPGAPAVRQHLMVQQTPKLFDRTRLKPGRYPPSNEALLVRAAKGCSIGAINSVVAVNNIMSLRFKLPMGVYDYRAIEGEVILRCGRPGEALKTMAKKAQLNIEGLLVSADARGAFGSVVSDSPRTRVNTGCRDILLLVYGPPSATDAFMFEVLTCATKQLVASNSGDVEEVGLLSLGLA